MGRSKRVMIRAHTSSGCFAYLACICLHHELGLAGNPESAYAFVCVMFRMHVRDQDFMSSLPVQGSWPSLAVLSCVDVTFSGKVAVMTVKSWRGSEKQRVPNLLGHTRPALELKPRAKQEPKKDSSGLVLYTNCGPTFFIESCGKGITGKQISVHLGQF
jgi:hypothetical protein